MIWLLLFSSVWRDVGLDAEWSPWHKVFQNAHTHTLCFPGAPSETAVEADSEDGVKGYLSTKSELLSTSNVARVMCLINEVFDTLGWIKYITKIDFTSFFCLCNVSIRKFKIANVVYIIFLLSNMLINLVFAYLRLIQERICG